MSLMNDFIRGFGTYGKALNFIFKNKMQWTFLIPILLNVLFIILGINLISNISLLLDGMLKAYLNPDSWEFWGSEFLANSVGILIKIVLQLLFFFLFAFLGGYVLLIIMSPLLAYISEKTEAILEGKDYPFSWLQLLKDAFRGIIIALRNFVLESIAIIVLFILSFVPLVQLISAPALFLISAYFYGFSFMDYTAERRKMKVKESVSFIRKNKGIAMGNGAPFAFTLLIPVVGVTLSTFIAIISSVAATIAILEKEKSMRTI